MVALRWPLVIGWLGAAAALVLAGPEGGPSGDVGALVPKHAASIAAREESARLFAAPVLTETAIVQRNPAGLDQKAVQRVLRLAARLDHAAMPAGPLRTTVEPLRGFAELGFALPLVGDRRILPGARENGTTAVTYLFFPPRYSIATRDRVARELARAELDSPSDHLVGVTGATPARAEQLRRVSDALPWIDLGTAGVVLLVVVVSLRAILAPLLVLASVGVTVVVARGLVAVGADRLGLAVPAEVQPLLVVLLLGIVTDYAVFLLSRVRDELRAGGERVPAVRRATRRGLPLVTAAALVVAAGTGALAVAGLGFFRSLGPALAAAAVVGLLVSATLVPACAGIAGRALFWPGGLAPHRAPRLGLTRALSSTPGRMAVRVAALATVAGLATLATFALHLPLGLDVIRSLPPSSEPAQAARALGQGIAPGAVAPTVVVIRGSGVTARHDGLARLESLLQREPHVQAVLGPREQPVGVPAGAVLARDHNAARIVVILDTDPFGADAVVAVRRLRRDLPGLVARAGLRHAQASIGGDSALAADTIDAVHADLRKVAAAALAVNLLLLLLLLRAPVAALGLLAASTLTLAAAIGVLRLLFVEVGGHADVTYFVPFSAAVLLLSLGSDYTMFVAGSVWQRADRMAMRDAVGPAVDEVAAPVSAAGVALALSFSLLAIVPLGTFRELAVVLAAGVLLDAFLVRILVVPVALHLLGELARWPSRRRA